MSQPETITDAIETRRRSRSKTPMMNLRVSSDRENGAESPAGRKVRKAPTVGVIEESVEQSPSTQTRSTAVRKTRVVTSDYSSDDISPDRVRQAAAAVVANVANMQLMAANQQQQQQQQQSGQLSKSAMTTTTTLTTTSSYESKTVVMQGGKQQEQQQITEKTTNSSSSNISGGKESATGKLVVTTASPKKGTSSPSKPSSDGTKQEQDAVFVASSKRTTSTTTKASTGALGSIGGVIHTSTPKNAPTSVKSHAAKVILTPEELQQHAAYKEYLEAGEYWNKFPKTDYTYSELSPHRREVAPGLVAMPNMSRPSLNKHAERVQTMIERNPMQEAFIRQRYTSSRNIGFSSRNDPYDSAEEVDGYLSGATQRQRERIEQQSIVSRFFLSIVMFFFTCFDSVRSVFRRREEHHQYYTRIEDERGFFARAYGYFSSFLINVFKRIYLMISSVLFLDAFLLQTTAGNAEQQRAGQRKRRFLLLLLVLLPFLVIGGTLFYLDPSALETVRANLPSSLPNLSELKLPNFSNLFAMPELPALPDVDTAKQYVGDRWAALSDLSGQYLEQLKLVTQNSADTIRQLWEAGGTEQETSA